MVSSNQHANYYPGWPLLTGYLQDLEHNVSYKRTQVQAKLGRWHGCIRVSLCS